MKKHAYIFLLIFSLLCSVSKAQYEYPGDDEQDGKKPKKEKSGWYRDSKLFIGGVPGIMFGSLTYIELPLYAGYKITPYFWAGAGPFYEYYKDNSIDIETSVYGGKMFAQLFVIKNLEEKIRINLGDIFVYAESSMLNIEPYYWDMYYNRYYKMDRKWINVTLVGFGFRYPIGHRSGFSLNILWDITQNPEYSYPNPEIRIGFDL